MGDRLLVGTRGSKLALAQTKLVVDSLTKIGGGIEFVTVTIKTAGDIMPPDKLGGMDGKTAFTSEIDRELAQGRVDIAVHSMKDLPAKLNPRLVVAATPERGDPRDALVSASGASLPQLGRGARVGTSSARRRSQLLAARNDLDIVELHGNVETRLKKLEQRQLDGVVLAVAGLERLGLGSRISQAFDAEELVPAVCQGVLAVEARADDRETLDLVSRIDDPDTRAASDCERAFSGALGGDCYVPLGAFARVVSRKIRAVGLIANLEGKDMVRTSVEGNLRDPRGLGFELATKLNDAGGREILKELKG